MFGKNRVSRSWDTDFPNITIIFLVLIALVNGLDLLVGKEILIGNLSDLIGGQPNSWIHFFLFPFRVAQSWISLILFLYVFWMFASQLEYELGAQAFFFYLLSGHLFIFLGTYFTPFFASYIFYSIFLAIAFRSPNTEILLFFILPVQLKWLAWVSMAFLFLGPIFAFFQKGDILSLLMTILVILNFLLFHYKDLYRSLRQRF